nr:ferritin-like domain-containing protein [[Clostridium] hylemonae]
MCERNRAYGRMMLDNMGGQNSEMSAVSLYVYNNLLIDEDARLSGIFHKISIVEMHHLHIFGEIARMMGENPRLWTYRGNQMTYWSPSYNNYPIEIRPLLTNALNGERKTVQKYEEQCRRIKDIHIVECLKRIIQDEEIHIHIFESLLEEYCR